MSKMTVIQLLNKIANGEEAPKRIKTKNDIWVYDDRDCEGIDYRASDDRGYMFEVYTRINKGDLNEEVEIIEDEEIIEDKEIEKLNWFKNDMKYVSGETDIESVINIILDMQDTINEIIDKLNKGK